MSTRLRPLLFLPLEQVKSIWQEEDLERMEELFNRRHHQFLCQERIVLQAHSSSSQVQVKTVLRQEERGIDYPIEAVCLKTEENFAKDDEIALAMLEYLSLYWAEYLESERNVFVTIDWSLHNADDFTFYLRGAIRHTRLEEEAQKILAQHGHGEYEVVPLSFED